jgi:hypothetical protein
MSVYKDFDDYLIFEDGMIFSIFTNKEMSPGLCGKIGNRYLSIDLKKKTKRHWLKIHRIIAETFIPNPKNLPFVNHIDGNKLNNNVENLEWVTKSENKLNMNDEIRVDNTSGIRGVRWNHRNQMWEAQLTKNYKIYRKSFSDKKSAIKYRKSFKTKEEAIAYRKRLENEFCLIR